MADEFLEPAFAGRGERGTGAAIRFHTGLFAGFREPDWAAVYGESSSVLRADRDLRVCATCRGDLCRAEHNAVRQTEWSDDRQSYVEHLRGYVGSGHFHGRRELRGWYGVRSVGPDGWPEWAIHLCPGWEVRRQEAIRALELGDEVELGPGDAAPRVIRRRIQRGGALEGSIEVELPSSPWAEGAEEVRAS